MYNHYPSKEEIEAMKVDYFTMPEYKLARRNRIGVARLKSIAEEVIKKSKTKDDYLVIKIERKRLAGALDILDRAGIKVEVPEKFELTEYVESKINK